ncbi:Uncharacterised protein [Mycobacteroides abscessus subsp. abscessus]|nr:Uncharacterised protein [Mycobacteroides abscessus subsp. abscessus]
MHDLPLERCHRIELLPLARLEYTLRDLAAQSCEPLATVRTPPRDVEHQPAAITRRLLHGEPGEFLERIQHLALTTNQLGQIIPAVDAHDRAVTVDIQIDVAVEVQHVQKLFEVVARDLAFFDETLLFVFLVSFVIRVGVIVVDVVGVRRGGIIVVGRVCGAIVVAISRRLDSCRVGGLLARARLEGLVAFGRLGVCVCCSLGCHISCTSLCVHR